MHGVRKRERGNKDDKEMKKEEGEKKNEKGKTKKQLWNWVLERGTRRKKDEIEKLYEESRKNGKRKNTN